MNKSNSSSLIFALLIFFNLGWALNSVLVKLLLESFTPLEVALLRYGTSFLAVLLGVFLLGLELKPRMPSERQKIFRLPKSNAWIVIGSWTFFLTPWTQNVGLSLSSASSHVLIIALEPCLAALTGVFFFKEVFSWRLGTGLAMGLAGVLCLNWDDSDSAQVSALGNGLFLLALTGELALSVLSKRLDRSEILNTLLFALGLGTFGLMGAVAADSTSSPLMSLEFFSKFQLKTVLMILGVGPFLTGYGYYFWMTSIHRFPVSWVAFSLFSQPLAGVGMAYLILGERLSVAQWIGGSVILLAVGLQFFPRQNSRSKICT